ncbi:MAG: PKD domain-containing protein, partial [Conexivisphaera sp.]
MARRRAVGDAIGALFMLILLVASVAILAYAVTSMYGALNATHSVAVIPGAPARENLTLVFVPHTPPNGAPGAIVVNNGIPVNITELVQVVDGNFVVTPENIYLPQGANAAIALQSGQFAVVTSTGAVFSYNMTMPYVSIFAEGVSTDPPPGMYSYVGTVLIKSNSDAYWYVNNTYQKSGRVLSIYVDGPTTVSAISTSLIAPPLQLVSFSAAPNPTDVGLSTTFSVFISGGVPPYGYQIGFGDGASTSTTGLTSATFTHSYSSPGTYTSTVKVMSADGQTISSSTRVVVNPALVITTFTASPNPIDVGQAVTFSFTVTGGTAPYTYTINYEDGSSASGSLPSSGSYSVSHTYTKAGVYDVVLTVTDNVGQTYSATVRVVVNGALLINSFYANPNTIDQYQTTTFYTTISGGTPPYSYTITFGDGGSYSGSTSSTSFSITHEYTLSGTFTAQVTVTDARGASSYATTTVRVNGPMSISASASPNPGVVGQQITVSTSITGGTPPYSYTVNFGDGAQSSGSTSSTSFSVSHAYSNPGTYTITVTVSDAVGSRSSTSVTVNIYPLLAITSFSASPNPANVSQAVTFQASVSGGGAPYTYTITFGDGGSYSTTTSSTSISTSHAYSNPGTYTATLVVTDSLGQRASQSITMSVLAPPIVFYVEQSPDGSAPSPYAPISGVAISLTGNGQTYTGVSNSEGKIVFKVPYGTYSVSYENPVPVTNDIEWSLKWFPNTPTSASSGNTYYVYYSEMFYVTLSSNPPGAGTVSFSPPSGYGNWVWYNYGLTVSETPNAGSTFLGWTGTYSSTSPSFSFTVTQPITEVANYLWSYTWTEEGLPSGATWSVTVNGKTYTANAGQSITVSGLQPNTLYSWSASASNGWSFFTTSGSVSAPGTTVLQAAIPIVLTNSQGYAAPAPFQQKIQFNPSDYLITNIGSIRFYIPSSSGSGYSETPAWVESASYSGAATVWVKLPDGIPAGSSVTIYMTANASGFDGNYLGLAPGAPVPLTTTEWTYSGTPPYPSGSNEPSGVSNVVTGYLTPFYSYGTSNYQGNTYLGMTTVPFPSPFSLLNNAPPGGTSYGYTATGSFTVTQAGSYTFSIETDDGMEIFINGPGTNGWTAVFGGRAWRGQGATVYQSTLNLQAGTYQIAVDYFNSCCPGVSAFTINGPAPIIWGTPSLDNGKAVFAFYSTFYNTLDGYSAHNFGGGFTPTPVPGAVQLVNGQNGEGDYILSPFSLNPSYPMIIQSAWMYSGQADGFSISLYGNPNSLSPAGGGGTPGMIGGLTYHYEFYYGSGTPPNGNPNEQSVFSLNGWISGTFITSAPASGEGTYYVYSQFSIYNAPSLATTEWTYSGTPPYPSGSNEPSGVSNV